MNCKYHRFIHGFTMIELVITIVLIGIIAASMAPIITQFMNAYQAQIYRGELVDSAQLTLDRITREVRLALPNSIRVNGNNSLEFLRTLDGGRFRTGGPTGDILVDDGTDDEFDTLGLLSNCNVIAGGGTFMTMKNQQPGFGSADAYQGVNIAPVLDCTDNTPPTSSHIIFDNSPLTGPPIGAFVNMSTDDPRFQIFDTPVSYLCASNEIRRYEGYAISATQPTSVADMTAGTNFSNDLLINNIVDCSFIYEASIGKSENLLTISLTIQSPVSDDKVSLMQQIRVIIQ